jgi:hypothetical protein
MAPVTMMEAARRYISAAIEAALIDAALRVTSSVRVAAVPTGMCAAMVMMTIVTIIAAILPAIVAAVILPTMITLVVAPTIASVTIVCVCRRHTSHQQRHGHSSSEQVFHRVSPRSSDPPTWETLSGRRSDP